MESIRTLTAEQLKKYTEADDYDLGLPENKRQYYLTEKQREEIIEHTSKIMLEMVKIAAITRQLQSDILTKQIHKEVAHTVSSIMSAHAYKLCQIAQHLA